MKCEKCTKIVDRIMEGLCWKCAMDLIKLREIVERNRGRGFVKIGAGKKEN